MYCLCWSLQSSAEREWLVRRYEEHRHADFGAERKKAMAEQLIKCQTFDRFLAKKFGTVKRYGAEGAESMMTFFDQVLSKCGKGKRVLNTVNLETVTGILFNCIGPSFNFPP